MTTASKKHWLSFPIVLARCFRISPSRTIEELPIKAQQQRQESLRIGATKVSILIIRFYGEFEKKREKQEDQTQLYP